MVSKEAKSTYILQKGEEYLPKVNIKSLVDYMDSSISPEYYEKKKIKKGRFTKFNKGKK